MIQRDAGRRFQLAALLASMALTAAACGSGDDAAEDDVSTDGGDATTEEASEGEGDLPNACPAEGCEITIAAVEAADDGEIAVTFDANFTPDFERNHIHIFWDTYEAGSVSSSYQQLGFDEQGKWHPTDEYPNYVTQADASVASEFRQGSTTLCVTAADTDHAVLDPESVKCTDVADLVG